MSRLPFLLVTFSLCLADDALVRDDECQGPEACAVEALQMQADVRAEAEVTAEANSTGIVTLFHQTSHTYGKSILKNGFRPGHVGWCGAGIYFATSAKATSGKIRGPDSHAGYMIAPRLLLSSFFRLYFIPFPYACIYTCITSFSARSGSESERGPCEAHGLALHLKPRVQSSSLCQMPRPKE